MVDDWSKPEGMSEFELRAALNTHLGKTRELLTELIRRENSSTYQWFRLHVNLLKLEEVIYHQAAWASTLEKV